MKRFLSFAFALAVLGSAVPALAQQYDRHGYGGRNPHYNYSGRDYRYVAWQRAPHRYRYWHGRPVYYYNSAWGYWGYRNGLHVFISVPL